MLAFKNSSEAIEFYIAAFGAIETLRLEEKGKVVHAEIKIDNIDIMIADEAPEIDIKSPLAAGGCPIMLLLVTDEVDRVFSKAVQHGAKIDRPVMESGGIKNGKLIDPFGYKWMISSRPK